MLRRMGGWWLVFLMLPVWAHAQALRSDFDNSGSVDFSDFLLFSGAFGGSDARFDLSGNGSVDFDDFLVFVSEFGNPTAGEPASPAQVTPAWEQIEATNAAPSERFDHSLILDPVRNHLVVFGGRATGFLNDTWIFDLNTRSWREVQTSPAPDARRGHTAVYDAPRRRMVIFAGQGNGFFSDVWAFDLEAETWSALDVSGNLPVARYGTSAVVDSKGTRMVISHGFTFEGRFDDTWAFHLVQHRWTELTPSGGEKPLKRCLHDAVLDGANNRMLLFGGCSSGFGPCPQDDLWAFDLTTNTWTQLQPSGDAPSARDNVRLNYDSAGNRMLLFGGSASGAAGDTWSFDAVSGEWSRFSLEGSMPPARWSHDGVLDAENNRLLIFGGTSGGQRFNDLWAFHF